MATAPTDMTLDIKEQIVRIDKMQAELNKIQAELVKVRVDTRLAPIGLMVTILGAFAAFFAAGVAVVNVLGR